MQEQLIYQIGNGDAIVPARVGNVYSFANVTVGGGASPTVLGALAGNFIYVTSFNISGAMPGAAGSYYYVGFQEAGSNNLFIVWCPSGSYVNVNNPPGYYGRTASKGTALNLISNASGWNAFVNINFGYTAVG